jgi:hypothetical protein
VDCYNLISVSRGVPAGDSDPIWPISEKQIDIQELADLPTDDLFGAGAVEIALTNLVC